ncbi:MAG: hypothetical protein HFJ65_05850 [Eggerthellaceae bacterium]|nr:hypothetical protein [Eggerthellaceae bacterium]
MRRGKNQTDSGHIKKKTQGTSNEISFSVLDAKRGQDEDQDPRSPLGRISLFTLSPKRPSGTPTKDTLLPQKYTQSAHAAPRRPSWEFGGSQDKEVKQRRTRRRRRRYLALALISAACIVGLVFAGTFAVSRYQQMQQRTQDLGALIEDVRTQVSAVEPYLSSVDAAIKTPLSSLDGAAIRQASEEFASRQDLAATKLRTVKTSIENLQPHLSGAEASRANDAIAVVNATLKTMDASKGAAEFLANAAGSYAAGERFMTLTLEGDSAAREAVSSELTGDDVANAAIEKSEEAIGKFAGARDAVAEVQSSAAGMIGASGAFQQSAEELLKPFTDYANLRIRAQEYAEEVDRAYLELSSQRLADANAAYNETETEAANLIAGLRGQYPTDIVQRAYDAQLPKDESVAGFQSEWARTQQMLEGL